MASSLSPCSVLDVIPSRGMSGMSGIVLLGAVSLVVVNPRLVVKAVRRKTGAVFPFVLVIVSALHARPSATR